jgi:hypothetical protein
LGDDLPGATPHPLVDHITHRKKLELLVLYYYCNNDDGRLHGRYSFLSLFPCYNLTTARLDAAILPVTTALLLLALYL